MVPQTTSIDWIPVIPIRFSRRSLAILLTGQELIDEVRNRRRFYSPIVEFCAQSVIGTFRTSDFTPELSIRSARQAVVHIDKVKDLVKTVLHHSVKSIRKRLHVVRAIFATLGSIYLGPISFALLPAEPIDFTIGKFPQQTSA